MRTDALADGPPLTTPGGALDELREMRRMVRDDAWMRLVWPILTGPMGELCGLRRPFTSEEAAIELIRFAATLDAAEPVLWRNALWEVVRESEPAYPWQGQTWTREMFMVPVQYWAMETDGLLNAGDTELSSVGFTGVFSYLLAVGTGEEVRRAEAYVRTAEAPVARTLRSLVGGVDTLGQHTGSGHVAHTLVMTYGPYGLRVPLPNLFRLGTPLNEHSFSLAARLDFMRSTIVESVQERGDRGARRRWEKQWKAPPPSVRVISLRRHTRASEDGEGQAVEWHHRWIVRGHWRQQPVGEGRKDRRPTFVGAYVKGPPDKPLLPTAERIWAVDR